MWYWFRSVFFIIIKCPKHDGDEIAIFAFTSVEKYSEITEECEHKQFHYLVNA